VFFPQDMKDEEEKGASKPKDKAKAKPAPQDGPVDGWSATNAPD
jgi:hypothetical protein